MRQFSKNRRDAHNFSQRILKTYMRNSQYSGCAGRRRRGDHRRPVVSRKPALTREIRSAILTLRALPLHHRQGSKSALRRTLRGSLFDRYDLRLDVAAALTSETGREVFFRDSIHYVPGMGRKSTLHRRFLLAADRFFSHSPPLPAHLLRSFDGS